MNARSLAVIALLAAPASAADQFKNDEERTLYSFGFQMGKNVGTLGFNDAQVRQLVAGVRDAALGKPAAVNVSTFLPRVNELIEKRVAAKSASEKTKAKAFSDKFAKEAGVKEIPGGGWIKHEKDGTGALPSPADTVKVHYRGTLIDGAEFDSSYARNTPASFALHGVIPCWTNGVALMKPGGKAKLVCPSEVAYGDQGHPPVIPGGATLIFEVELLEVTKAEPAKKK